MIFIADLIACSTCFGHHYAHHQELESIIQVAAAPHHTDNLKTKAPNTTGSSHLYNTLELLMMGIMVPETCWASNKICYKNHLLHLVGILFPHINDDALSKPHQIQLFLSRSFRKKTAWLSVWNMPKRLLLSVCSFLHFPCTSNLQYLSSVVDRFPCAFDVNFSTR